MSGLRLLNTIQVKVGGARGPVGIKLIGEVTENQILVKLPSGPRDFAGGSTLPAGSVINARGTSTSHAASQSTLNHILVTPEAYGAAGDGTTDDTTAIKSALAELGPGVNVRFDGTYLIAQPLTINNKAGWTITGKGKILAAASMPVADGQFMLKITNCANVEFGAITLDANRSARGGLEKAAHNLIVGENCSGLTMNGTSLLNAVCDGLYIGSGTPAIKSSHATNILIENVVCDNAFRNGCSVIQGSNVIFRGGRYTNSNGTAPQAGIDLESNSGDIDNAIENVTIDGVSFQGNKGYGLSVSVTHSPRHIKSTKCNFLNNTAGAITWGAISGTIDTPFISGYSDTGTRGAIDIGAGVGGNLRIVNPRFRNITTTTSARPLVYTHASSAGNVSITGVEVDSAGQVVSLNGPKCSITDSQLIGGATVSPAIYLNGADCEASRNTITAFKDTAFYADSGALRHKFNDNNPMEPTSNATPVYRSIARAASVRGKAYRSASANGSAYRFDAGADIVGPMSSTGFTGSSAYALSGTFGAVVGLTIDGAPLSQASVAVASATTLTAGAAPTLLGTVNIPGASSGYPIAACAAPAPGLRMTALATGAGSGSTVAIYGEVLSGSSNYTIPAGTLVSARLAAPGA